MPSVASRISTGILELVELLGRARSRIDMTSVDGRADQRQHLHEAGEGVDDEGAVEGAARRPVEQTSQAPASDQDERRASAGRPALARSPGIGADHQQRQRADGEDELRQSRATGWR